MDLISMCKFTVILCMVWCSKSIFYIQILKSSAALCLDGSPSAIYVEKGDPQRILIHFESGGWCGQPTAAQTLESCYQRSRTNLGSSNKLPDILYFANGILSKREPNIFTNWTKIFFNYCDGAGHQGYRSTPIKYKDALLYFRGTNITLERFDYLQQKYGLYSETNQVVLSGASAGGLATYFWSNYLQSKIVKARFRAVADSGIFLNSYNFNTLNFDYRQSFKSLLAFSNEEIDPPNQKCVRKYPQNKELCMFAEHIIQQIQVQTFTVQSLYDSWSIQNVLGLRCAAKYELAACNQSQRKYIEQYHQNTSRVLNKIKTLKGTNGYWANGCVYHGYTFFSAYNSPNFKIPMKSGSTISKCIAIWLQNLKDQHYYEDMQQWPYNSPCSNSASALVG